ncbi:MAG: hypothetical protein WCA46_12300, partial [Actinocatenispora sp.]
RQMSGDARQRPTPASVSHTDGSGKVTRPDDGARGSAQDGLPPGERADSAPGGHASAGDGYPPGDHGDSAPGGHAGAGDGPLPGDHGGVRGDPASSGRADTGDGPPPGDHDGVRGGPPPGEGPSPDRHPAEPAPTWQKVVASVASVIVLLGMVALVAAFGSAMIGETHHGARAGILALELLPFLPPVFGGVMGTLIGRQHGRITAWCYGSLGALLGLAIVAVVLYGLVAIIAYLFARDWQF